MTHLFQTGNFQLHSGGSSDFKIECDALTEQDWQTLALQVARNVGMFREVVSVPHGGDKLAYWLEQYKTVGPVLVVDDVLTSGNSIQEMMHYVKQRDHGSDPFNVYGFVIFARHQCPPRVRALFYM